MHDLLTRRPERRPHAGIIGVQDHDRGVSRFRGHVVEGTTQGSDLLEIPGEHASGAGVLETLERKGQPSRDRTDQDTLSRGRPDVVEHLSGEIAEHSRQPWLPGRSQHLAQRSAVPVVLDPGQGQQRIPSCRPVHRCDLEIEHSRVVERVCHFENATYAVGSGDERGVVALGGQPADVHHVERPTVERDGRHGGSRQPLEGSSQRIVRVVVRVRVVIDAGHP